MFSAKSKQTNVKSQSKAREREIKEIENVQNKEQKEGREGETLERQARDEGQAKQGDEGQGQPLREAIHQRETQGCQPVSEKCGFLDLLLV